MSGAGHGAPLFVLPSGIRRVFKEQGLGASPPPGWSLA